MNDKQKVKEIARLMRYAAEYLDSAAGLASTLEDEDSIISGDSVRELLRPMLVDLREWATDIDHWYGE